MKMEIPPRFKAYVELFEGWIRPLEPGDGLPTSEIEAAESKLALILPFALKEIYGLVGNSLDDLNQQNYLLPVDKLRLEGDEVVFYVENQSCHAWSFNIADSEEDDPPVWIDGEMKAAEKLSEFVFGMMIIEATFRGPGGMGWLPFEDLPRFRKKYKDFGFTIQVFGPTSFLYDRNTLLFLHQEAQEDAESDTPAEGGGLMSWIASKAIGCCSIEFPVYGEPWQRREKTVHRSFFALLVGRSFNFGLHIAVWSKETAFLLSRNAQSFSSLTGRTSGLPSVDSYLSTSGQRGPEKNC